MKSNNQYLKNIAQKTGNQNTGHRSDNYYLKQISETIGTSDFSGSYNDLTDKPSTFTPSSHNHTVSDITDFPVIQFIEITDDKGTASADTMGKLYIVSENNKVNAYYSVEDNGSYSWEQLDEDILDNITIPTDVADLTDNNDTAFTPKEHSHSYNDLTNKPSIPSSSSDLSDGSTLVKKSQTSGLLKNDGTIDTNTYLTQHQDISGKADANHTHGNISNTGAIGSDSGKVIVTTTDGALTASDWIDEVDNIVQALIAYGVNL